jgi:hypothetical protein
MPIESEEEFLSLLCSKFDIADIGLLITVPDDDIRVKCNNPELAQLVIELKHELIEKYAEILTQAH